MITRASLLIQGTTKVFLKTIQSPSPLALVVTRPKRNKIWINKLEPPEWFYAEQPDLMNVELANALNQLKPADKTPPPFLILDLRDQTEREMIDLPKYTTNKALIPRVNIPLDDLLMGYYPDKLPKDRHLILMCDRGFKSGRAADFLKRNGFHVKILLGGIEALD